jgi:hypothetical protein
LAFTLVLAIGAHLYEYGVAGPVFDGPPDIQAIRLTVAYDVLYLQAQHARRPGDGITNGMLNNFESWFLGYHGCGKQADEVANNLQFKFPQWQVMVVASPVHQWVLMTRDNQQLRIDPWTGEIGKIYDTR